MNTPTTQPTNRRQPRRHEYTVTTPNNESITAREFFASLKEGRFSLSDPNLAAFIMVGGEGLPISYAVIIAAEEVEPYETCSAVDPSITFGPFQYHLLVLNLHPQSTPFCRTIRYVADPSELVIIGPNPLTEAERRRYVGTVSAPNIFAQKLWVFSEVAGVGEQDLPQPAIQVKGH